MKLQLSEDLFWELLRISLGFIMLWAFLDKLLGLGFATKGDKSWFVGVSPTAGFLKFGTEGPFSFLFQTLSGNIAVDILFMAGLLLVGLALLLGIGTKIAGYAGSLMMFLIYLSLFPPENNPIIDEHIVYILVFIGIANTSKGRKLSFAKRLRTLNLVKSHPILR